MDSIVGRFTLQSLHPGKSPRYCKKDDGSYDYQHYDMLPSVLVTMAAVKTGTDDPGDELFGIATPSGRVEMTVQNPTAAAWLEELWHEWLKEPRQDAQPPKFEVTFRLLK